MTRIAHLRVDALFLEYTGYLSSSALRHLTLRWSVHQRSSRAPQPITMPTSNDNLNARDTTAHPHGQQRQQQLIVKSATPQQRPTPPKKNFNSLSKGLKLPCFTRPFFPPGQPPPPPPPPSTITCSHCKRTGVHYTKDCPLWCDFCAKPGHDVNNCTPECPACAGRGEIRKARFREEREPEHESPAARQFVACLEGARGAGKRCVTV